MTKVNYSEQYWTDAPIAIIQSGGIRTSINEVDHDGNFLKIRYLLNRLHELNLLAFITFLQSD